MYESQLMNPSLHIMLENFDAALAEDTRSKGCPHCGGKLDRADYERKPRGGPEHWDSRHSFCCREEGCRRRLTPPSVRFLGRKVYTSVMVVLMTAMKQGLNGRRIAVLRQAAGVNQRTLQRWRRWWLNDFAQSRLWKNLRAWFMPPVAETELPLSLCERFRAEKEHGTLKMLCFLKQITTESAPEDGAM